MINQHVTTCSKCMKFIWNISSMLGFQYITRLCCSGALSPRATNSWSQASGKIFRSPSRALGPLCSICLCGKSGDWLLHFYLVDLEALLAEKYSFAQHVVELSTFEDLEVIVTFRSTWFHTNPNYNNYWNNSSFHFTRDKLNGYCKNLSWKPRFSFLSAFRWIWKV